MQQASLGTLSSYKGAPVQQDSPQAVVKSEHDSSELAESKVKIKEENCADETPLPPKPKLEVREEFRQIQPDNNDVKPKFLHNNNNNNNHNHSSASGLDYVPYPSGYHRQVNPAGSFPSFGFSPFYGLPQTPPSFSPDRASGGSAKHRPDDFRANSGSDAFIRHDPGRFEPEFHHHQQQQLQQQQHHGKPIGGYPSVAAFQSASPYPEFRVPLQQQQQQQQQQQHQRSFAEQRNNNYGRSYTYSGKQRKWSNNALRALHPPAPWSSWYFRPESPFPGHYGNHVLNSGNNSELSSLSRPQIDLKRFECVPERANKIHGQTPTICTSIKCTVNGCSCESFTPGKRYLRCCENCHHGWVPHAPRKTKSSAATADTDQSKE